jgi:hypothetical protein
MVKSLREIGDNRWVLVGAMPGADGTIEIAGKGAATKLITQSPVPNGPGNPADLDEFMSIDLAKYGTGIDFCLEECNGLYILAQMIEKAQSLDPDVIKAAWEGMEGQTIPTLYCPSTVSGTETYGIKGHVLSNFWPALLIDNGEYSGIGWYPAPLP